MTVKDTIFADKANSLMPSIPSLPRRHALLYVLSDWNNILSSVIMSVLCRQWKCHSK